MNIEAMQDHIWRMPKAKECLKTGGLPLQEALIDSSEPVCLGVGSTNIARQVTRGSERRSAVISITDPKAWKWPSADGRIETEGTERKRAGNQ